MEYHGKLYGKSKGEYFPLIEDTDYVKTLERKLSIAKQSLKEIHEFDDNSEYDDPGEIAQIAIKKLNL